MSSHELPYEASVMTATSLAERLGEGDLMKALYQDPRYGPDFIEGILPLDAPGLQLGQRTYEPMPELMLAGKLRDPEDARALRHGARELDMRDDVPSETLEMLIGELVADQGKHVQHTLDKRRAADNNERVIAIWRDPRTQQLALTRHTFGGVKQGTLDKVRSKRGTGFGGEMDDLQEGGYGSGIIDIFASDVKDIVIPSLALSAAVRERHGKQQRTKRLVGGMVVTSIVLKQF